MIFIFSVLLIISGAVYLGLLVFCFYQWSRMKEQVNAGYGRELPVRFSIIIPARNEAETIIDCLESLVRQTYPAGAFEIIIMDDFSTDNTAEIVQSFSQQHPAVFIRVIRMADVHSPHSKAYKKQAIAEGINQSRFDWILTTDADCLHEVSWLASFNSFIKNHNPVMVCGPVRLDCDKSLFKQMQALEFAGLIGTAGAALEGGFPMTCNGANLAYSKEAFYAVDGFSGIDNRNSGDDEMLMMKMHEKWPGRVRFLKSRDAVVHTPAQRTVRDFLQQRKRWVSKSRSHGIAHSLVLIFIYLFHALIITGLAAGFFDPGILVPVLIAITGKAFVEWPFLYRVCVFLGRPKLAFLYPLALIPQTFYVFVIGIYGNLGAYKWKGRTLR